MRVTPIVCTFQSADKQKSPNEERKYIIIPPSSKKAFRVRAVQKEELLAYKKSGRCIPETITGRILDELV